MIAGSTTIYALRKKPRQASTRSTGKTMFVIAPSLSHNKVKRSWPTTGRAPDGKILAFSQS